MVISRDMWCIYRAKPIADENTALTLSNMKVTSSFTITGLHLLISTYHGNGYPHACVSAVFS